MHHGSHKLSCRISRQLGIRVKGDYELYVQQRRSIADDEGEPVTRAVAQKGIQFRKFSPLALVTHPDALHGIPSARAVKQEERIAFRIPVLLIQLFDSLPGKQPDRIVLR